MKLLEGIPISAAAPAAFFSKRALKAGSVQARATSCAPSCLRPLESRASVASLNSFAVMMPLLVKICRHNWGKGHLCYLQPL